MAVDLRDAEGPVALTGPALRYDAVCAATTPGEMETAVLHEEFLELVKTRRTIRAIKLRAGNVARHVEADKIDR